MTKISKMKKFIVNVFIVFLLSIRCLSFAQLPEPCMNGTQNSCKCFNAPLLNCLSELDGFEYDMTLYQHPLDGPQPMCPPPEGNGTTSSNPTWFAFYASCSKLSIKVSYTSCIKNIGSSSNTLGVQAAVYSDCPATPSNAVACDTDVANCKNDGTRIINITNLEIDKKYYFLVDGCAGSACHIKINVLNNCGPSFIKKVTVSGEPKVFKDSIIHKYSAPKIDGASKYIWKLDNNIVSNTNNSNELNLIWKNYSIGTHKLCMVYDSKCFNKDSFPQNNCLDIVVSSPEPSGTLNPRNRYVCNYTNVNFKAKDAKQDSLHQNVMFVTSRKGEILKVNVSSDTISYKSIVNDTFKIYSFNYNKTCDTLVSLPIVGKNRKDVGCKNCVCSFDSTRLVYTTILAPSFINPPANITISCNATIPNANFLRASNFSSNNKLDTIIYPYKKLLSDSCSFNNIWEYIDPCDRKITHVQEVKVISGKPPVFQNPPQDITLSCGSTEINPPSLSLLNNDVVCPINLLIPPSKEGITTSCGGTKTYKWSYVNNCGQKAEYQSKVTFEPKPLASFVNPPADITVNCNNIPNENIPLEVNNNGTIGCQIRDTVLSSLSDIFDGKILRIWTFTDECSRTIYHAQKITVFPSLSNLRFVNPPADVTVSCDKIPANGMSLQVISDGAPGCEINEMVAPTQSGNATICGGTITYTWTFTAMNITISHVQNVTVIPMPLPFFVELPADITVDCSALPLNGKILKVTNNGVSPCDINADIGSIISGAANKCGGEIFYSWFYTDVCNRLITHSQKITVKPAAEVVFDSLPKDLTIDCSELPYDAPDLKAFNLEQGECFLSYNVKAVQTIDTLNCIGKIINTWALTDNCGRSISHQQKVTIEKKPVGVSDEVLTELISIYPNPGSNYVTILLTSEDYIQEKTKIKILNESGESLKVIAVENRLKKITINTQELASGTYFFNFQIGGKLITKKWVKL